MTDTMAIGEAYYKALGEKNIQEVSKYLHQNIEFSDPQQRHIGKDAVLKAASGFMGVFKSLTIRTKFGSEDKAMVVYEVEIPGFSKKLQAASLLSFHEGLISKLELFYDAKGLA